MAFRITDGSRDDRKPLEDMTAALQGKIFADQGYVSKSLLERLWQWGLHRQHRHPQHHAQHHKLLLILSKIEVNEGITLISTADVPTLKTTSGEVDGLESSEGSLSHLRLGIEAVRPFPLSNGASLLPSLALGIRQDSSDAETGLAWIWALASSGRLRNGASAVR